jgi:hypothetical protein
MVFEKYPGDKEIVVEIEKTKEYEVGDGILDEHAG